jgi:hypothetical protein
MESLLQSRRVDRLTEIDKRKFSLEDPNDKEF